MSDIYNTKKYELSDLDRTLLSDLNFVLFYDLQATTDPDQLIFSVIEGVKNAIRQLPFMAGDLQVDDTSNFCIITRPESQINVNIHRCECTEYKSLLALAKNSFAPDDLDFSLFLPKDPEPRSKKTVCALQLSLINGGMTIGLRFNHAAGDWTSIDAFLSLICRGSKALQEGLGMPIYVPDLNRTPFNIPEADFSLSKQALLEKFPLYHITDKNDSKSSLPPPPSQSRIYRISRSSIQQLIVRCAPYLSGVDYITSYDCISSLIWRAITRARLHLLPEKTIAPARLIHPINVRTRDPEKKTSERYFGNAVLLTQAGPVTAQTLVSDGDRGIAAGASLIRQSIYPINLTTLSEIASLVPYCSPTEDVGIHADFSMNDMSIFMNSWSSGSADKYHIGGASVPIAFRVQMAKSGSTHVIILPNYSQGESRVFEILLQSTIEEQKLLEKDAEFSKYFELVA